MDKIQELKRKHYNVKEVLKERIKNGKEVQDKVDEYLDIVKELRKLGVEVNDSSPRVLEALEKCGVKSINCVSPMQEIIQPPQPEPPLVSIYRITLAWTERPGKEPDNTVQIIENYLKENDATFVDESDADFDDYVEHMRSYEWSGDDKEFKILRKSANYILEVFAENQYEKFNISIFGNKKR